MYIIAVLCAYGFVDIFACRAPFAFEVGTAEVYKDRPAAVAHWFAVSAGTAVDPQTSSAHKKLRCALGIPTLPAVIVSGGGSFVGLGGRCVFFFRSCFIA